MTRTSWTGGKWCRSWREPLVATLILALGGIGYGRDIAVTNAALKLVPEEPGHADVTFDLGWSMSWHATWTPAGGETAVTNWDAAWVFVKFRPRGGAWRHAPLETSGHTAPAGCTIDTPGDGMGVFVRRSGNGSGHANYQDVGLRWRYSDAGVKAVTDVDVGVHALEMVYVPEGAFWAGNTNGVINSSYHAQGNDNAPVHVVSEDAFTIHWGEGDGNSASVPAPFPKGYAALYCMKYEITEGQYVAFFNTLAVNQKATRDVTGSGSFGGKGGDGVVTRNTLAWDHTDPGNDATTSAPDRACNYLGWADGEAYADWAGLRPMTELEYEKACRGPIPPVPNEYAWGTTTIQEQTGFSGPQDGTETAPPAHANCNYWGKSGLGGAVRVGIWATASSSREQAGASYWGIMELSGNLWERTVSTANSNSLRFTAPHGNGALGWDGHADVPYPDWPGRWADGGGVRGGVHSAGAIYCRTADRSLATSTSTHTRIHGYGWRGVRSAP